MGTHGSRNFVEESVNRIEAECGGNPILRSDAIGASRTFLTAVNYPIEILSNGNSCLP